MKRLAAPDRFAVDRRPAIAPPNPSPRRPVAPDVGSSEGREQVSADDLAKILDELGRRLGPTGSHVFELAVRQVYIDSVIRIVVGVILLVAGTFVLRAIRRHIAADWARWNALPADAQRFPYSNNKPDILGGSMWWFCLPGAMFAVSALAIVGGLSGGLNPEYAALRDLLRAIKP